MMQPHCQVADGRTMHLQMIHQEKMYDAAMRGGHGGRTWRTGGRLRRADPAGSGTIIGVAAGRVDIAAAGTHTRARARTRAPNQQISRYNNIMRKQPVGFPNAISGLRAIALSGPIWLLWHEGW